MDAPRQGRLEEPKQADNERAVKRRFGHFVINETVKEFRALRNQARVTQRVVRGD
jgi:hypothetical protein